MPERRHYASGSRFEPPIGFSRATRVGDHVYVSGTGPIWEDGSFDAGPVHAEFFGEARPAATALAVAAFLDPRWRVEIEADAIID